MSRTTRSRRLLALVAGASIVFAACGGDDDDDDAATSEPPGTTAAPSETTAPAVTETTAAAPGTTGGGGEAPGTTAAAPSGDVAMTITFEVSPDAVWEDGTPITAADFECTWQANANTPGSITAATYANVIGVTAGETDQQVIATFDAPYAPYKGLWNPIIKKAAVEDCNDISGDFEKEMPISGRAYKMESWSPQQSVFVPNENFWGDAPVVPKVVMVPKADSDTEIASIKAAEVDFIYPQFFAGIEDALQDPNVKTVRAYGGDFEALYFQQLDGPFADPVFREAFSKSIDIDAFFQQIYASFAEGRERLTCGPIVPGDYCPEGLWEAPYDAEGAAALLTENGWAKDAQGFWAKDGAAPEIRWMVNTGNTRRESAQAYLIPLLAQAGFNVVQDNCEAECVFQQRLPALDYDLAMYINTAPPDPGGLTPIYTCDNVPTEENDFQGQNQSGWCNEDSTEKLHQADVTVDPAERATLIKEAIVNMETDYVLLPLFQFPKTGAYRTDRVGDAAAVEGQLNNFQAFYNFNTWQDLDGDGQIVIGAEQWPNCLNPVTECANSSWYVWTAQFPLLPGVWDTTNDQTYEITNLVTGEPVVEVAE